MKRIAERMGLTLMVAAFFWLFLDSSPLLPNGAETFLSAVFLVGASIFIACGNGGKQ